MTLSSNHLQMVRWPPFVHHRDRTENRQKNMQSTQGEARHIWEPLNGSHQEIRRCHWPRLPYRQSRPSNKRIWKHKTLRRPCTYAFAVWNTKFNRVRGRTIAPQRTYEPQSPHWVDVARNLGIPNLPPIQPWIRPLTLGAQPHQIRAHQALQMRRNVRKSPQTVEQGHSDQQKKNGPFSANVWSMSMNSRSLKEAAPQWTNNLV